MNESEAVSIWLGVGTGEVPKQLGGERTLLLFDVPQAVGFHLVL
jgi:hypothetical protein